MAAGLRERGVADPAAGIAAETGVAVFRAAFDRWVADEDGRELTDVLDECLTALRRLTAA